MPRLRKLSPTEIAALELPALGARCRLKSAIIAWMFGFDETGESYAR